MVSEGRKMEEVERDFHGMKRKQLQALCKKHGIPANKSNAEMADLLTLTLKVCFLLDTDNLSLFNYRLEGFLVTSFFLFEIGISNRYDEFVNYCVNLIII